MTLIVAFDPGITTGIARSDGTTAALDLRAMFAHDRGEAMAAFAERVEREIAAARLVLIERPFGRLVATLLPEVLTARIHEIAFRRGVARREIAVATIRKAVCGDARADKKAVQAAVSRAGWVCATPHEADAVAVLLAGIEMAKRGEVLAA